MVSVRDQETHDMETRKRDPAPREVKLPVEDQQMDDINAFSYLVMVKAQQPEIYNRLLDTINESRTDQIDTPGVIDRVFELFADQPLLVQGFNALAPQGYRIEVSTSITVTTPSGTRSDALPRPVQAVTVAATGAVQKPPMGSLYQETGQWGRDREWLAQQQQQMPVQPQADLRFNAAMDYVNRIKQRFQTNPDIYRQFLGVLQACQRGGQTDCAGVVQQITLLFRGNQDLIEEFNTFVNFSAEERK